MKVALVYDRVNKWGGAERVLLALHEMFPEASLFTSVYAPQKASWAHAFPKVVPSFLQRMRFSQMNHEYFALVMPIAFESFNFASYDLVISVTSEAAKGIITGPDTRHINYCLTPTRYLWSGYKEYFKSRFLRLVAQPFVLYLRHWDQIAATRPDMMIAISQEVSKRIARYYGRKAPIIYPPIDDIWLAKGKSVKRKKNAYLVVSRLVDYKRVEDAVLAFRSLEGTLTVIGDGVLSQQLQECAPANVTFIRSLTDSSLKNYYESYTALICPQEEDFGLVAAEAQACGMPVIAYKKGGIGEIVVNGKTGILFDTQGKDAIIRAIESFEKKRWNESVIRKNAQRFTKKRFVRQFKRLL